MSFLGHHWESILPYQKLIGSLHHLILEQNWVPQDLLHKVLVFQFAQGGANSRWRGRMWAHLVSDQDLQELHAFAQRIGLKRSWFQRESYPHYDITAVKRDKAIAMGAREATPQELIAACHTLKAEQDAGDLEGDGAMPVKALTLWRPWPTVILLGPKRVENRPRRWTLPPGGLLLAIHSGRTWDDEGERAIREEFPRSRRPQQVSTAARVRHRDIF